MYKYITWRFTAYDNNVTRKYNTFPCLSRSQVGEIDKAICKWYWSGAYVLQPYSAYALWRYTQNQAALRKKSHYYITS